ncbi:MAG: helix-turn-helix domain-containing protein [Planctomycetaceae bacterium]|nr:helix-turn-helix domain-containing protein [Planctomycetaceae bacterium]
MRPREAAQALGISERTLWSLTRDKRNGVPHLRVGRAVLYPTAELRAWLERRTLEVRP